MAVSLTTHNAQPPIHPSIHPSIRPSIHPSIHPSNHITTRAPSIPPDKPNHLLGIADEPSIWAGAALGVDTFDSCFPTRIARHGTLLTQDGPVYIRKGGEVGGWVGGGWC